MLKSEFLEKLQNTGYALTVPEDEYKIIEFVYTWHPSISDVSGKEQIAWLYARFGFRIILDMYDTALKCSEINEKLSKLESERIALQDQLEYIKRPDAGEVIVYES